MPTPGAKRAPRDPEKAARHVAYELAMLRTTYASLRGAGLLTVVILEDFLVHTRNLIEFFWDCAPRGTILPKDFEAPARRDKEAQIGQLHDDISQLLSHLTWARVEVHELRAQDWDYGRAREIHDAIRAKARIFFASLPQAKRTWFVTHEFPNEYQHWMQ